MAMGNRGVKVRNLSWLCRTVAPEYYLNRLTVPTNTQPVHYAMDDLDSPATEMNDIMASTNLGYPADDGKRGSSWIVISYVYCLSILKFISEASPNALECLLLCFGCLELEIFYIYKVVLSLLEPNAFIGTLDME
jgi:hypothetical protein